MVCFVRCAVTTATGANETEGAFPACPIAVPASKAARQPSFEMCPRETISNAPNTRATASDFLLSLLSLQSRRGCRSRIARLRFQRLLDRVLDFAFSLQPDNLVHNLSIAPNEEALRQRGNTAVRVTDRLFSEQDRVIDSHIFSELGDIVFAGIIHRNPNYLQS